VLRLTPKGLWLYEEVRTHRTSVNFVRHQMAQLHHIDVADHHFLIERIPGASIEKLRFTVFLHPGETFLLFGIMEIFANFFLLNSVEDRSRDFESECLRSNSQMGFQDLPDVHSARHA